MTFYAVAGSQDLYPTKVFYDRSQAEDYVVNELLSMDWFELDYDDTYERCDAEEWSRKNLPYGIVELEADRFDQCYDHQLRIF